MIEMKKNRKGFTIIELIVVMVIMAIVAAFAVPAVMRYLENAKETKLNNVARSLYLAAQQGLTDIKNRGVMSELAAFDGDVLDGGYVFGNGAVCGQVPAQVVPAGDAANESYLYYAIIPKASDVETGNYMLDLLDNYVGDKDALKMSIVIEFNAKTGVVLSAYYSDQYDSFSYSGGERSDLSAVANRKSSDERGYYGVDYTGAPQNIPEGLNVSLVDGGPLSDPLENALYVRASMPSDNDEYLIELLDATGQVIKHGEEKTAVQFTAAAVTSTSFAVAKSNRYESNGQEHIVYRENTVVNGENYTIITWVLDYTDYAEMTAAAFDDSIAIQYPEIEVGDMKARIYSVASPSKQSTSLVQNSYYMAETVTAAENAYIISAPRHVNNIRFVGTQPDRTVKRFTQRVNVSFDGLDNLAPLNWIPADDGTGNLDFDIEKPFVGSYVSIPASGEPVKLSNVTMHNPLAETSDFGLFGVIAANGTVDGIRLDYATIESTVGGNVGGLAGQSSGTINRCVVFGNINVNSETETNVGGLVGELKDGTISQSYNGGFFDAAAEATVEEAEQDSVPHVGDIKAVVTDGEANIGGLCGLVIKGKIENSYNNARINIDKAAYDEDAFESYEPEYTSLGTRTQFTDVAIGGVVGKNYGDVKGCYATNFAADYGAGLNRSQSAAVIGVNEGSCANSLALRNNLRRAMGGTAKTGGRMVAKKKLEEAVAASALSSSFEAGSFDVELTETNAAQPDSYPYPVLIDYGQVTQWENIQQTMPDLAVVTCQENQTDDFHDYYRLVIVETAESFYDYKSNKMTVTVEWDGDIYTLDNSREPVLGNQIEGTTTKSVTFTVEPSGRYEIWLYNRPTNSTIPGASPVTVSCYVDPPDDNPLGLTQYEQIESLSMNG